MNEKLVAGIVTAAGIAPLCAICVLGTAAIGSMVAGVFGWLGGVGPLLTVALMISAGVVVYRTLRRKHQLDRASDADRDTPQLSIMKIRELEAPRTVSGVRSAQQGER